MVLFLSALLLLSPGATLAQREPVLGNRKARQINPTSQVFDPVVAAYQGSSTSQNQYYNAYSPAPDFRTVIQDTVQYSDPTYPVNGYNYYEPQENQGYLASPYNKPVVTHNSEESYIDSDANYRSTIALINVFGDNQFNYPNNEHSAENKLSSDFSEVLTHSDQSIYKISEPFQSEVQSDLQLVTDSSPLSKHRTNVRELTSRTKAQPYVSEERDSLNTNKNTGINPARGRQRSNAKRQRRRLKVARKRGGSDVKARKALGEPDVQQNVQTSSNRLSSVDLTREERSEQHRFERPRLDVGRESSKSTVEPKSEQLTTPSRSRTRSRSRSRQRARAYPSRNNDISKNYVSSSPASRKQEAKLSTVRSTDRFRTKQKSRPTGQKGAKKSDKTQSSSLRFPRKNLFPDLQKFKVSNLQDNQINSDRDYNSPRSRGRSKTRNRQKEDIRPSPSFRKKPDYSKDFQNMDLLSGKEIEPDIPDFITVTHQVPTRTVFTVVERGETKSLFADTFETSLQIVDVGDLKSTEIHSHRVVYAHIETNHPQFGVTEYEIEAIQPTRTSTTEERTLRIQGRQTSVVDTVYSTIYNVEKITARATETPQLNQGLLENSSPEITNISALLQNVILKILSGSLLGNNAGLGGLLANNIGPTIHGPPQTQFITHTRSFITTTTSMETIVLPVNFRGAKIYQTITDLKIGVVTTTDLSVQTVLNFEKQRSQPFLPLAPTLHRAARVVESQGLNNLNLPYLPYNQQPPPILSTSFITKTYSSLTLYSTDITSDITITLGGREITTQIIEPSTVTATATSVSTETVLVKQPKPSLNAQQQIQLVKAILSKRG